MLQAYTSPMAKVIERSARAEHRWPAIVAILIALAAYALLPSAFLPALRYSVVAIGLVLLVPMIALNPHRMTRQTRLSRLASMGLTVVLGLANTIALVQLVTLLVTGGDEHGAVLILAALQVWATQVIVFGLVFWELDRGGPVWRTQKARKDLPEADFRFPQDENGDSVIEVAMRSSEKADWTANFVDYLYYSLSNSMAFSPPDAVPLTNRAKLLTGLEALGSYILLVLVIARAVSLLGS
jgi:uncharacterized membrane protein